MPFPADELDVRVWHVAGVAGGGGGFTPNLCEAAIAAAEELADTVVDKATADLASAKLAECIKGPLASELVWVLNRKLFEPRVRSHEAAREAATRREAQRVCEARTHGHPLTMSRACRGCGGERRPGVRRTTSANSRGDPDEPEPGEGVGRAHDVVLAGGAR